MNKLTALPVPPLPGVWALEACQPLLGLQVVPIPLKPACLPRQFVERLAIDWSGATKNKPTLWSQANLGVNSDPVTYWLCGLGMALDSFGPQYPRWQNGGEMTYLRGLWYLTDCYFANRCALLSSSILAATVIRSYVYLHYLCWT